MALFATGVASQTAAVSGTVPVTVWGPSSAALAALSPAVTLKDVTLVNAGANTCFLGTSTVTLGPNTGFPLVAGAQLTIQGSSFTSGSTTGTIFAVCGAGTATTVLADLATLASVA